MDQFVSISGFGVRVVAAAATVEWKIPKGGGGYLA